MVRQLFAFAFFSVSGVHASDDAASMLQTSKLQKSAIQVNAEDIGVTSQEDCTYVPPKPMVQPPTPEERKCIDEMYRKKFPDLDFGPDGWSKFPANPKDGDSFTRPSGSQWVFKNGKWTKQGGTWKPGDKCEKWCWPHPDGWQTKCNWNFRACGACGNCLSLSEEPKARLDLKQQELNEDNAERIKEEMEKGGCRKCPPTEVEFEGMTSWRHCDSLERSDQCRSDSSKCSAKCVGEWGHVWRSKMIKNWRTTTQELEEEQYLSWEKLGNDYCCWSNSHDEDPCPKCSGFAFPSFGCPTSCAFKGGGKCCKLF